MNNENKNTMKNLFERLKPEYREGLEKNREEFKVGIDFLEHQLKTLNFWTDLTIGQAMKLCTFTDSRLSFGDVDELFGKL